jgi:K+-transporting ATPase KdpC subunit
VQTFNTYASAQVVDATALTDADGNAVTTQVIALGPVASQIAIKQLGTNGGGFFNVNSAHPLENSTPLSNFVELLSILLIPAALCYTFGKMVGDTRQSWAVLIAMTAIFVILLVGVYLAEQAGNPAFAQMGIDQLPSDLQSGGNMEGKEVRNVIGSELIGQQFSDPAYFWGRLSATGPVPYNAAASSGSNYGPLNPALIGPEGMIRARIDALRAAETAAGVDNTQPIPVDLVTASASGLDPHISPAAAQYQVPRIAALRSVDESAIQALVDQYTEGRTLGVLGEPRVNVLLLNLALDEQYPLTNAESGS